jgi:hypothetical protein
MNNYHSLQRIIVLGRNPALLAFSLFLCGACSLSTAIDHAESKKETTTLSLSSEIGNSSKEFSHEQANSTVNLLSIKPISETYRNAQPQETVTTADGTTRYTIVTFPTSADPEAERYSAIIKDTSDSETMVLLEPYPDETPSQNLTYFYNLKLSQDEMFLYFNADAWTTSPAVHAINLITNEERFLTDGALLCTFSQKNYQNNLVVQKHKYLPEGGSYYIPWLYDSQGKSLGPIEPESLSNEICKTENKRLPILDEK